MEELGVVKELPILRKNRCPTGIKELDIILEGGYRRPGNILLIGPSGMEKEAFSIHFGDAAGKDENVYFVCGGLAPQEIMKKASTIGIDLSRENIWFIDCYTATLGVEKAGKPEERIKMVPSPSALNELSLALNEAMKESEKKRMRVIFHTLSTFVLYNPQDSIRKFLNVIEGRLKTAGATALYLIDEGVHDKQILGVVEQGMDEKYVIAEKNGGYNLEVPSLAVQIPFKLGPSGIIIV
ncbi:MAG: ATPase domain-containing protein [Candidatus Bilamarchaeaceae archaeon]